MTNTGTKFQPQPQSIVARAPGKVVLAGEYAVLAGAPALVMAVNRFAKAHLTKALDQRWHFSSSGFTGVSEHALADLRDASELATTDPARLTACLVEHSSHGLIWPEGLRVHTDSQAMYHGPNKLGLGSSAALSTALAGAYAHLLEQKPPEFASIHRAHQASQGGVGSGLDVATSLQGGLIRFESGVSQPAHWPDDLHYRFVYAGLPASTVELVGRFNHWRGIAQKAGKIDALSTLFDASATLANGAIKLDNFARYIHALRALDDAATIGIFSAEHVAIATVAERMNVLYKPCGAGGGDLGVAISDDPTALQSFTHTIGNNFAVIDLEMAAHGLIVS